jgi:hypothetical protein|tara:strand:+ start:891 stop:1154 length:264 start_codon:yes stop_codon:yes gene_type:complete
MAITKTEVNQRTEVYVAQDSEAASTTNEGNPTLMVVTTITFDDTGDAELPAVSNHVVHLSRYDADGVATVITGQAQIVQDICAGIWA